MAHRDLQSVRNAEALTFIGQKKIEVILVEVVEEEVAAALVDLQ